MALITYLSMLLGLDPAHFFPGLIGGLFSLRWVPQVGWLGRISAVAFGGLLANWWTPSVHAFFNIQRLHPSAVGFLIGLFAMSLSSAIFKAISEANVSGIIVDKVRALAGLPPSSGGGTP